MNLFDTLNEALNDGVVSKIAKMTDEEPSNTKKALDGIFYTLVAGLIRRTGSAMSVNMLYNQIQKGNYGGELLRDVESFLNKKDKLEGVLKNGESLVSQIFPAAKSPLISMIGAYAGIKKSSSTMYSSLAVPILIDAVSKEIADKKLDVEGLVSYLLDHHESLFKNAPEGLMEKMIPSLGLQELTTAKFSANRKATPIKPTVKSKPILETIAPVIEEEIEGRKLPFKWLIPLLIGVLAIAGGIYWYFNYYQPSSEPVQEETPLVDSTIINSPIDSASTKTDSTNIKKDSTTTPTLSVTSDSGGYSSFGEGLNTYLTTPNSQVGQVFPMTNLAFGKGSPNLDTESDIIISELADLMKKYPKMQIQIQGHSTDAVGTKNMQMGVSRAFAVKKRLLSNEIASTRIDAVGSAGGGNKVDIKVVAK